MLLLTMFLVAIAGVLLSVAGPLWHTKTQRDKEADLLWIGDNYARAIASYHAASPAQMREYPQKLEQLLLDLRQPNTMRHLRRLYRDPMTGSTEWGLIKDGSGRITGVYSLGKGAPLKQGGFEKNWARFNNAKSYADWIFVAEPDNAASPAVPGGAVGGAPSPNFSAPASIVR